jgi:thioredoxin reductase
MATQSNRSVAIIGGGPVGLAAAAHALERGLDPIVLEAGPSVGYAVQQWGHVRMFSPWEYNIDKASARLLDDIGWNSPNPAHYPTGTELMEHYLRPLADRTRLSAHVRTSSTVVAISRAGFDKVKTKGRDAAAFEVRYQNDAGPRTLLADTVIDVSGTWSSPSPAGASGLDAVGERTSRRISYSMPDVLGTDRPRFAGKRVAVLGAGHSAIGTLIDLVRLSEESPGTQILWLLRGTDPQKAFGGGANDKLAARGELGAAFARLVHAGKLQVETGFHVSHLSDMPDGLRIGAGSACCGRHLVVDELIVATGFRPDFSFVRELRLNLDPALECPPALAPLIDPNEHSCGTVRPHGAREMSQPEHGFYFAGMKSYGRAPTFLMLTGYEQVRSIIADIAGDKDAAERVELVLPETGVCSRSPLRDAQGCCASAETGTQSSIAAIETGRCCAETRSSAVKQTGCCS